jgi:hypothetical protein
VTINLLYLLDKIRIWDILSLPQLFNPRWAVLNLVLCIYYIIYLDNYFVKMFLFVIEVFPESTRRSDGYI